MSHYAVATMKKLKANNLSGIFRHDFRESQHHKNQDIDVSKSGRNIELVASHKLRKQDVMNYIQRHRQSSRKVRKDAVVVDEWIVSSDKDFFKDMDREQIKHYFKTAVDYFGKEFGQQNIMYGSVHLDESTPHMHMGIVPLTKQGKLSSKQVFNRNSLRRVQSGFPKYMREHGFSVVRGSEKSKRKKLTVGEYKHVQEEVKQARQREMAVKHRVMEAVVKIDPEVSYQTKEKGKIKLADHPDVVNRLVASHSLDQVLKALLQVIEYVRRKVANQLVKLKRREKAVSRREQKISHLGKISKQLGYRNLDDALANLESKQPYVKVIEEQGKALQNYDSAFRLKFVREFSSSVDEKTMQNIFSPASREEYLADSEYVLRQQIAMYFNEKKRLPWTSKTKILKKQKKFLKEVAKDYPVERSQRSISYARKRGRER